MKSDIKYIECKEGPDKGKAWIARVWFSKSWKIAYFNGTALY